MFAAYDQAFSTSLQTPSGNRRLRFRLSPRMTKAGGTTARFAPRRAKSSTKSPSPAVCSSMASASRIADHRVRPGLREPPGGTAAHLRARNGAPDRAVVLADQQLLRAALSGHRTPPLSASRTHAPADHAARTGRAIGNTRGVEGDASTSKGRDSTGRVNRLTKRATVLVEDPEGERFSDGGRYRRYYVPIVHLRLAEGVRSIRWERCSPGASARSVSAGRAAAPPAP